MKIIDVVDAAKVWGNLLHTKIDNEYRLWYQERHSKRINNKRLANSSCVCYHMRQYCYQGIASVLRCMQYLLNLAVYESAVNQSVNSYLNTYHHGYKMLCSTSSDLLL